MPKVLQQQVCSKTACSALLRAGHAGKSSLPDLSCGSGTWVLSFTFARYSLEKATASITSMHDRCRGSLVGHRFKCSAGAGPQQVPDLTCPTSMEAVFFRLLQGVHTISTLFSLQPWMLLAFTSCRHDRASN